MTHDHRSDSRRAKCFVTAALSAVLVTGTSSCAVHDAAPAPSLAIAPPVAVSTARSDEQKRAELRAQLVEGDLRMTETGAGLILTDVLFENDSWFLSDEAIKRLDPLIAYLRASPGTKVKIEGFTDNEGTADRRERISLDRAQYVARVLTVNTTTRNDVESYGRGAAQPLASNATAAGRARNRRVEITLQEPKAIP